MKFFQDNERTIPAVKDGDPIAVVVADGIDEVIKLPIPFDGFVARSMIFPAALTEAERRKGNAFMFQTDPARRPTLHFDRDSKWDWLSDKVRGFIGLR